MESEILCGNHCADDPKAGASKRVKAGRAAVVRDGGGASSKRAKPKVGTVAPVQ